MSELVGCTPEYIRQLVAKHEAAHAPNPERFTAHELDYMPAPGETPLPRPAPAPTIASKEASNATTPACGVYVKPDVDLNSNSCETGANTQLATDKQPQVTERENDLLPLADLPTAPPLPGVPSIPPLPAASVKRYVRRPAPARWDKAQLVAVLTYQIGPVPVAGLLAFLLLVLLLAR